MGSSDQHPNGSLPALDSPFALRTREGADSTKRADVHVFGRNVICETDTRGFPTPRNLRPEEIVVDASEGFIPLWAAGTTLRWRFQERSLNLLRDSQRAKAEFERLLGLALLAWGDAVPIKFAKREDAWDFEVVIEHSDRCEPRGCTLARAFFPDAGRHDLVLYPKLFEQSDKEQIDTLAHEIGHIFGLRHFFADVSETAWPSEVFGVHRPFSIMNYGHQSELSDEDRSDLKRLYQSVWAGDLSQINGTPIRLVKPYHTLAS